MVDGNEIKYIVTMASMFLSFSVCVENTQTCVWVSAPQHIQRPRQLGNML